MFSACVVVGNQHETVGVDHGSVMFDVAQLYADGRMNERSAPTGQSCGQIFYPQPRRS